MKLDKRRRLQGKTNYNKRIILLKGNSPRLVVRKTNNYVTLQIIESKNSIDKILFEVSSRELLKHGFPKEKKGSLKSISASYLSGLLLGKKAKSLKGRIILDSGLIPNTKGSRIYAAVKGISDSGMIIKFDEKVMPSTERIEGKGTKLSEIFNKIKEKIK